MLALLKAIRPINLLIVGATQLIVYYLSFHCMMPDASDLILEQQNLVFPFILVTILITIGGYLINDLLDFDTDLVNNKAKGLSQAQYGTAYFVCFALGLIIAYYIAIKVGKPSYTFIYIAAFGLLYFYSAYLKKTILLGNILVAIFTAYVICILMFAEYDAWITLDPMIHAKYMTVLNAFMLFSFLGTMAREIVKDIEDIEGDRMAAYKTLPIVWGVRVAEFTAVFFLILLLWAMVYWIQDPTHNFVPEHIYVAGLILGMTIFFCIKLMLKSNNKNYHRISSGLKVLMCLGLLYYIIISIFECKF